MRREIVISFFLTLLPLLSRADIKSRLLADSLVNEAYTAMETRHYDKAIGLLDEASRQADLGIMVRTDINLLTGECYKNTGEFAKSSAYFNTALQLAPDLKKRDEIILNLCDLYFLSGMYAAGLEKLALINEPEFDERKLTQEGKLLFGAGRTEEASDRFKQVLSVTDDLESRANLLQNIAMCYWAMDSLPQAISIFTNAFETFPETSDPIDYNLALSNFALLLSEAQRHSEAIDKIDRASSFFNGDDTESQIVLRKKAEIYLRAGRKKDAERLFKSYYDKEKKSLLANFNSMSRQQKLNLWAKQRNNLSRCFLLEEYSPDFLFDVAMFRRQTSLSAANDSTEALKNLSLVTSDLRKKLEKDESFIQFISYEDTTATINYAALILTKEGPVRFRRLFDSGFLETAGIDRPSILETIDTEIREDLNDLYNDTATAEKIWGRIIEDTPHIKKIYFTPEGIFNFWAIESLPFPEGMDMQIYRLSSAGAFFNRHSRKENKGKTLLAGGLNYDEKTEQTATNRTSTGKNGTSLSKSDFGNSLYFSYLKGTLSETDSISAIINAEAVHSLNETDFKITAPEADLIHLATHGFSLTFGITNPKTVYLTENNAIDASLRQCGLALTGANLLSPIESDDNIIDAQEISELDLSSVDFIVLSACQTAKGNLFDEGSAGIVRGLKTAGVKTILATLWSVNDNATMLFMQEFYRNLKSGLSKHDALVKTQNKFKNEKLTTYRRRFSGATMAKKRKVETRETDYSAPYFWAPFILIDDLEQ